jgi:hypothetical protein
MTSANLFWSTRGREQRGSRWLRFRLFLLFLMLLPLWAVLLCFEKLKEGGR